MKAITTKIILIATLLSLGLNSMAQVAVNNDGTSPDASAMLDVKSIDMGVLLPRMTAAEIADIVNPANGLLVFNTDDNSFYFFDNGDSEWKELALGTGTIVPTPPLFSCGNDILDTRDNKSYTTVQIDNQCWMAENLNIGIRIDGNINQTQNTPTEIIEKYCYNDEQDSCDIYGGLYQWNEMMQYVTTEGAQGICPAGWHLPSDDEWKTLIDYLGGQGSAGGYLKETGYTHWNSPNTDASNTTGFTALPGGQFLYGSFSEIKTSGFWWSSSFGEGQEQYFARSMHYNQAYVNAFSRDGIAGYSVRCLKD